VEQVFIKERKILEKWAHDRAVRNGGEERKSKGNHLPHNLEYDNCPGDMSIMHGESKKGHGMLTTGLYKKSKQICRS